MSVALPSRATPATAREDRAMHHIRLMLTGAVFGIAWACSPGLHAVPGLVTLGIAGFLYASARRWRSRMAWS